MGGRHAGVGGPHGGGVRAIALAATAALALAGLVLVFAGSAESQRQTTVAVALGAASQERLVEREAVGFRWRAPRGASVRVAAFERRAGDGTRRASPVRRLIGRGEVRRGGVALRDAAVRRIARCAEQRLVVVARSRLPGTRPATARARVPIVNDSPRCREEHQRAGGDPQSFRLGGPNVSHRQNGAPRNVTARELGEREAVTFQMFACDAVSRDRGGLVFEPRADGTARLGSTPVGFDRGDEPDEAGEGLARTTTRAVEEGRAPATINGADGCGAAVVFADEDGDGRLAVDEQGRPTEPYGGWARTVYEPLGETIDTETAERCDFLDPAVCLQPFPNDSFTRPDSLTDTGLRLALPRRSMPRNRLGSPIAPRPINRSDGFSPGSLITVRVPGLDSQAAFDETGAVPVDDLSQFERPDQPVLVIDAETGERHPIFAEVDANPASPADVNLLIRPAVNLDHSKRYIVALRNLRAADGRIIPAPRGFEIYRDRVITREPAIEARRARFDRLLGELEGAGVDASELHMAWDFTVASADGIAGPMLSIRDRAFAELGDTDLSDMQVEGASPRFVVTDVRELDPCGPDGCDGGLPFEIPDIPIVDHYLGPVVSALNTQLGELFGMRPQSDTLARRVKGYVVVPCFLNLPLCPPGAKFSIDPQTGEPRRLPGNVTLAPFTCNVPRSAVDGGADAARPSLYGHGLLGSGTEVGAGNVQAMGNEHNVLFCATDWSGFATRDLPAILLAIQDLSLFTVIPDGSQQGFLNQLFLGRAMIHPEGLASHEAFRLDGEPLIDTERLYYDGNSQGGILGGALTAVAPDFDRAVLGVPGMNYSTLLRRSVDFDPYATGEFLEGFETPFGLYDSYPSELERPLILSLMQIMWDRSEANGYAHHMTSDPLPNTPPHEVLMHVAFGDHQVTQIAADVMARTVGAHTNEPPLFAGRSFEVEPLWRIPRIASYPFDGSASIYWDSGPPRPDDVGVVTPPTENVPPRPPEYGRDPHGDPRADPLARVQKSQFMRPSGRVVDVCGGGPCYAAGFTGP